MPETDVLVVGAGPTGLMLACELALAGVRCRVLERRIDKPNLTRAFGLSARTVELLDARGLADELLKRGVAMSHTPSVQRDGLDIASNVRTRYPMILIVPQSGTEKLLEGRAAELGVPIVHGAEATGLRQDHNAVELEIKDVDGSHTERARFVVGCDGAHSTIRRLLGVDFVGAQYETHILLADARFEDETVPPEEAFGRSNEDGVVVIFPFGDGWFRAIVWDRRRETVPLSEPVTDAELRDALRRIAGSEFGMGEMRWSSRFLSERRQARKYRVGNVFLAGDAAHVHSPLGGQGMNTGLQDAFNLGWKLAAAVHERAPSWLLDSYQEERHPVATGVLALTDRIYQRLMGRSWLRRVHGTLRMRLFQWYGPTRRRHLGRVTGVGVRYPARPDGAHPWVGGCRTSSPTSTTPAWSSGAIPRCQVSSSRAASWNPVRSQGSGTRRAGSAPC